MLQNMVSVGSKHGKIKRSTKAVMYMKKQKQPVEAFVMVGIMILSKLRSAKNEDRIENMKEKNSQCT